MKRLGMREGEEISHPWVTRAIERAQRKVEAYHFDIRKNLLEYDQVMNEQRGLVYTQRQEVLEGHELSTMIRNMMVHVVEDRVQSYLNMEPPSPGDEPRPHPVAELKEWLKSSYRLDVPVEVNADRPLVDQVDPVSRQVLAAFDKQYEERRAAMGPEVFQRVERFILLLKIDEKWKDHLHAMDQLRHAVGLRSYGQIDPKIAYKQEGYQMFAQMIDGLRSEVTQLVFQVRVEREDEERLGTNLEQAEYRHGQTPPEAGGPVAQAGAEPATGPRKPIVNKGPKPNRNSPCTCGSGKKYKWCCGAGA
jgi:preprotein translocase subunit SecA